MRQVEFSPRWKFSLNLIPKTGWCWHPCKGYGGSAEIMDMTSLILLSKWEFPSILPGTGRQGYHLCFSMRGLVLWALSTDKRMILLWVLLWFLMISQSSLRSSSLSQYPNTLLGRKHLWSETSVVSYWNLPSEWQWNNCAWYHSALEVPTFDLCQASDKLRSPDFRGLLSGELDLAMLLQPGFFFLYNHEFC